MSQLFMLDWHFWSVLVSFLALLLSQLPPVYLWFRPRRLEVEVQSRLLITHKVGNPYLSMYVNLRNTGGRELRIQSMNLDIQRDGSHLVELPAQQYFESASSQGAVLFVPFSLKPGEDWSHGTGFINFFDRSTEKHYREIEYALKGRIAEKLLKKSEGDQEVVLVEEQFVTPFLKLFEEKFIWLPGEYIINLKVVTEPGSASFRKKYRFIIYESDTSELKSYQDDYPSGAGISYNSPRHVGLSLEILPHEI